MTTEPIKLTDEQTAMLFQFVEWEKVKEYDVQVELVDHFASQIEELMNSGQNLDFDSAWDKVYCNFRVFGFDNLVKERTKMVGVEVRRLWRKEFKSFWKWPEVIYPVILSAFLFLGQQWTSWSRVYLISLLIVPVGGLLVTLLTTPKKKQVVGLSFGQWLLNFTTGLAINIALQVHINKELFEDWSHSHPLIMNGFLLITILAYFSFVKIHLKVNQALKSQYPQAFA